MIEDIAKIVEEKTSLIYERALHEYMGDHPDEILDNDIQTAVKQRATSQLMFSLSGVTFPENVDQQERIDAWYTDELQDEVVSACKRCMAEEVEKKASSQGDGLSDIDRYLRKHGMGLH